MTKEEKLLRDMLKPERDEINLLYSRKDYDQKLSPLITAMRKAVIEEVLLRISHYYSGSERICEEIRKDLKGKR